MRSLATPFAARATLPTASPRARVCRLLASAPVRHRSIASSTRAMASSGEHHARKAEEHAKKAAESYGAEGQEHVKSFAEKARGAACARMSAGGLPWRPPVARLGLSTAPARGRDAHATCVACASAGARVPIRPRPRVTQRCASLARLHREADSSRLFPPATRQAKEAVFGTADTAATKAGETKEAAGARMGAASSEAQARAAEGTEWAKQKAGEASQATRETAEGAKEQAGGLFESVRSLFARASGSVVLCCA